ncbi:MAG: hypothetical protein JXQ76_06505 [Campylobacterales bacterium]|nr:hypothetical protein [Campylobacterales bacterium]
MVQDIFTASTPQEAYTKAKEKYGTAFKVLSARQIPLDGSQETICEILINVTDTPSRSKHSDEVREIFVKRGIDSDWIERIIDTIKDEEVLQNREKLTSYLLNTIYQNINEAKESLDEQKIMMFVGPTGVGKTTNIAKLAARYSREFDQKVALINLDKFKAGAREQLGIHADTLNLTHIVVDSIDDFTKTMQKVDEYDKVLIDSAGISPFDIERMIGNIEYVLASHHYSMHITLVLSALSKEEDLEDIYQNFSFLNLDALLISKFDETRHIGNVINFLIRHKMTPLSYISIGQNIPNDILCESKHYILDKFVGTL